MKEEENIVNYKIIQQIDIYKKNNFSTKKSIEQFIENKKSNEITDPTFLLLISDFHKYSVIFPKQTTYYEHFNNSEVIIEDLRKIGISIKSIKRILGMANIDDYEILKYIMFYHNIINLEATTENHDTYNISYGTLMNVMENFLINHKNEKIKMNKKSLKKIIEMCEITYDERFRYLNFYEVEEKTIKKYIDKDKNDMDVKNSDNKEIIKEKEDKNMDDKVKNNINNENHNEINKNENKELKKQKNKIKNKNIIKKNNETNLDKNINEINNINNLKNNEENNFEDIINNSYKNGNDSLNNFRVNNDNNNNLKENNNEIGKENIIKNNIDKKDEKNNSNIKEKNILNNNENNIENNNLNNNKNNKKNNEKNYQNNNIDNKNSNDFNNIDNNEKKKEINDINNNIIKNRKNNIINNKISDNNNLNLNNNERNNENNNEKNDEEDNIKNNGNNNNRNENDKEKNDGKKKKKNTNAKNKEYNKDLKEENKKEKNNEKISGINNENIDGEINDENNKEKNNQKNNENNGEKIDKIIDKKYDEKNNENNKEINDQKFYEKNNENIDNIINEKNEEKNEENNKEKNKEKNNRNNNLNNKTNKNQKNYGKRINEKNNESNNKKINEFDNENKNKIKNNSHKIIKKDKSRSKSKKNTKNNNKIKIDKNIDHEDLKGKNKNKKNGINTLKYNIYNSKYKNYNDFLDSLDKDEDDDIFERSYDFLKIPKLKKIKQTHNNEDDLSNKENKKNNESKNTEDNLKKLKSKRKNKKGLTSRKLSSKKIKKLILEIIHANSVEYLGSPSPSKYNKEIKTETELMYPFNGYSTITTSFAIETPEKAKKNNDDDDYCYYPFILRKSPELEGKTIYLSGSLPKLGSWDPFRAIKMDIEKRNKEEFFSKYIEVEKKEIPFEYKFFFYDNNGKINWIGLPFENYLTFPQYFESLKKLTKSHISIINLNIRYINTVDGINIWDNRKYQLIELLLNKKADIFFFQEITHPQSDFIDRYLSSIYEFVGEYRDSTDKSEKCSICVNKLKYTINHSGQFWLSSTPYVPGSNDFGNFFPRICTWASLKQIEGISLLFMNVHLDHANKKAHLPCVKVLIEEERKIENRFEDIHFVFIAGCFYCEENDEEIKYIRNQGFTEIMFENTYHAFTGKAFNHWDYMFWKEKNGNDIEFREAHVMKKEGTIDDSRNHYISDHFPIYAEFFLKNVKNINY